MRKSSAALSALSTPHVSSDDSEKVHNPVLKTAEGQRVYDQGDIPALIALCEIELLLVAAGQLRLREHVGFYLSAADRHRLEFRHGLAFGCCAERGLTSAAAS